MKISTVTYLENGYFEVKYVNIDTPMIQDIGSMKMQVPTDICLKEVLLFLRRIKLEKIAEKDDFDELKYRNYEVVVNEQTRIMRDRMKAQKAGFSPKPMSVDDPLDALLKKL